MALCVIPALTSPASSIGCDPRQANLDLRMMSVKVIPKFRGSPLFVHASHLLLSYVLDPVSEGGLGMVRIGWRSPPENLRSHRAAEKIGLTREGVQRYVSPYIMCLNAYSCARCYEVSDPSDALLQAPYPHLHVVPDGTGRITEDAVIFSMTVHDWLGPDHKRERLEKLCRASVNWHPQPRKALA